MKAMKMFGCLALVLGLMVSALPARALEEAGRVTEIEGTVQAVHADGQSDLLKLDAKVYVGDRVQTGPKGKARVLLRDDSLLTLASNTRIEINELVYKPQQNLRSSVFSLFEGKMMSVVGGWFSGAEEKSHWEVRTPTAVAGVRGTTLVTEVQGSGKDARSTFAGLSGLIGVRALADAQGRIISLQPNYFTTVPAGSLASDAAVLDPAMLQELLAGFEFSENSLDQRGDQVRQSQGVQSTMIYLTPEALAMLLGEVLSEEGQWDNPADLIFNEPPDLTSVKIRIQMP